MSRCRRCSRAWNASHAEPNFGLHPHHGQWKCTRQFLVTHFGARQSSLNTTLSNYTTITRQRQENFPAFPKCKRKSQFSLVVGKKIRAIHEKWGLLILNAIQTIHLQVMWAWYHFKTASITRSFLGPNLGSFEPGSGTETQWVSFNKEGVVLW